MADHHSHDLDQLLDSALDDFKSLNLTSSAQRVVDVNGDDVEKNKQQSSVSQFENVKGLGLGLPDLNNKRKGKQKLPQPVLKQDSHVNEALNKLREQTKEAVKGLEAVTGGKQQANMGNEDIGDAMIEDWVKQFEELAGSQDMDSIVQTMMQHLLSKEILHEPMKEISERYPKWLEENKPKLTNEEYVLYSHQSELVEELNQIYESEPNNFSKIVELMQKIHECGQPPNDILQELGPEFDLSSLGQMSPEMLESPQNCCIM